MCSRAFPAIAGAVSSRDAAFRQACLATLEIVYDFEGQKIWKMLGRLTDQQRSLIEERLKVRSRQLSKERLAPGFRNPNANVPAEESEVQARVSPNPEAFGQLPSPGQASPGRASPGSGIMPPSNNGHSLAANNEGRIPVFNNMRGIPRPLSYSPSPGCAKNPLHVPESLYIRSMTCSGSMLITRMHYCRGASNDCNSIASSVFLIAQCTLCCLSCVVCWLINYCAAY